VSGDRTMYLGLLFASASLAVLSAAFLLRSPEEGGRPEAWFWGAWFLMSSFVFAWTFWELLDGGA
jgi:hypothetical protein